MAIHLSNERESIFFQAAFPLFDHLLKKKRVDSKAKQSCALICFFLSDCSALESLQWLIQVLTGLAKACWCVPPTDTHSSFSTSARQLEMAVKFF